MPLRKCSRKVRSRYTAAALLGDTGGCPAGGPRIALWKPASVAQTGLRAGHRRCRAASSARRCVGSGEQAAGVGVDVADVEPGALVADAALGALASANDGAEDRQRRAAPGCALTLR